MGDILILLHVCLLCLLTCLPSEASYRQSRQDTADTNYIRPEVCYVILRHCLANHHEREGVNSLYKHQNHHIDSAKYTIYVDKFHHLYMCYVSFPTECVAWRIKPQLIPENLVV